jgi:hypothetical protein
MNESGSADFSVSFRQRGALQKTWFVARRLVLLSSLLIAPAAALAQQAPGWDAARQAILDDYARAQPKDKVIEVTGPEKREAMIIAVRYYGVALVERADRTRSRDRVTVEYRLVGDHWDLYRVHVYEQNAVADLEPPAAAEALRLFTAAWPKDKCEGFDILDVKLDGAPRYQQETTADRANAKRWYVYHIKVAAKGNGKFRMSEDGTAYVNETQNLLLWHPAEKSWSVEPQQLRCSFSKVK